MPTYDYRCKDCGHEFEIQQSFSDDALTECPQCGGSLRKVFSAVGIAFNIFLQTALHISVNLNLVPTTGEPLPFIPFGGSSLVTFMFGLGIVESVVMRRKMLEFDW